MALYLTWVLPAVALVALVGLGLAGAQAWRRSSLTERALAAALAVLALALRVALPPGGWGDQRATLAETFDGWGALHDFGTYGRGIEAVMAPVVALLGLRPPALEGVSLVAGVLSVPALVAFARAIGLPRAGAWTAGLLLAVAPLHVRYSPTLNRYVLLVLLWLGSAAVLAWRVRGDPARGRGLRLAGGVCGLVWAAQCRPDAVWLPALALALVVALGGVTGRGRRDIALAGVWVAALLALPGVDLARRVFGAPEWTRFTQGAGVPLRGLLSADHNLLLCDVYTPWGWAVLATWGAALGLRAPESRRLTAWLLAWALIATAIPGTSDIRQDLLSGRYHLIALPAWLLLAGWGAERLMRGLALGPRGAGLLAVGLAAAVIGPLPWVTRTTTQDEEVVFLRRALSDVPDDCLVVRFAPQVQDLGLRPSRQLSMSAGRRHRWSVYWQPEGAHAEERCAVWYRSSSCAGIEAFPGFEQERQEACDQLARLAGMPIAAAALRNDPAGRHRFQRGGVLVGLYWLRMP